MANSRAFGVTAIPVGIVGRPRGNTTTWLGGVSRQWTAPPRIPSRMTLLPPKAAPRSTSAGKNSPAAFDDIIRATSRREGVDEQLVKAVVEAESGFNPKAVSKAGAKGLMQLMDGTARSLGVRDSFDPASNIAGGTKFLRSMLDRFGSVPLALAAYNAGPGAVEKYGGVPPYQETKSYVDRVLSLQRRNQIAAASKPIQGGDGGRGTIA